MSRLLRRPLLPMLLRDVSPISGSEQLYHCLCLIGLEDMSKYGFAHCMTADIDAVKGTSATIAWRVQMVCGDSKSEIPDIAKSCPWPCLCLEAMLCQSCAVSATRIYVQDERQIITDPCDNRIIVARCHSSYSSDLTTACSYCDASATFLPYLSASCARPPPLSASSPKLCTFCKSSAIVVSGGGW